MSVRDSILSVAEVRRSVAVDLGDFDEVYRGAIFEVWVTPPAAHRKALEENQAWLERETGRAQRDRDGIADAERRAAFDLEAGQRLQAEWSERLLRWLAATWLNVELDEARQIREHLVETNPMGWDWLFQRTMATIGEYRRRVVGNSSGG